MDENTQVLVLYDGIHEACYVTKNEMYTSAHQLIGRLREPHTKFYEFRSVFFDDLDSWETEIAWYAVNDVHVPKPFDERRPKFLKAFDLLWEQAKEVYK